MIIVYAQSTGRQGLDSALDGVLVEDSNPEFIDLRERGRAIASANPDRVGGVELHYSRGLARLVFDDTGQRRDSSPITAIVDINDLQGNSEQLVAKLTDGVTAIGCKTDYDAILTAARIIERMHTSYLSRRRFIIAGCIGAAAAVVVTASVVVVINALPKQ